MKMLFTLVLCFFTAGLLFGQGDRELFKTRTVNCYSVELNVYLSNTGKKKYGTTTLPKEGAEAVKKMNNSLNKVLKKTNQEIVDFNNFEAKKDVFLTGLGAVAKETTPFSSIILDPLMKVVDYEREQRKMKFEKDKEKEVRNKLLIQVNNVLDEGDRDELLALIENENDPFFVSGENEVVYNRKLIQAVKRLGEGERAKLMETLNEQQNEINDLVRGVGFLVETQVLSLHYINENKKAIEENNKTIEANRERIKENRILIEQNALRASILEASMINHEERISQNTENIKDIQTMLSWDKSSLESKLKGLKSGKYDRLFKTPSGEVDIEKRDELIKQTENLKLRKEITYYSEAVEKWGGVASEAINTFFPDADPKITKAIDLGVKTAGIVGAFASQNYPGAVMGIISLFGKKKRDPNGVMLKQIMKEIRQLRKEMHERFDRIEETLSILDEKIVAVGMYLEQMNKDIRIMHQMTMQQLFLTDARIRELNRKLSCIEARIVEGLSDEVNTCQKPFEFISKRMVENPPQNHERFIKMITRDYDCQSCVNGLADFFAKSNPNSHVFDATECSTQENGLTDPETYNKILEFWIAKWKGKYYNHAQLALLYPAKVTVQGPMSVSGIASEVDAPEDKLKFDLEKGNLRGVNQRENNLYRSSQKIVRFSNYLLTFYPMLEVSKPGGTGFYSFLELMKNPIGVERRDYLKADLEYMVDVIDFALAQQAVYAGHLLLGDIKVRLASQKKGEIESLINILENNSILAHNFTNYIIALNYVQAIKKEKVVILESSGNLKISRKNGDAQTQITIETKVGNEEMRSIIIPIPKITSENKNPSMLFSIGYYEMLQVRKRLIEKLSEINFISNLTEGEDPDLLSKTEFKSILILD